MSQSVGVSKLVGLVVVTVLTVASGVLAKETASKAPPPPAADKTLAQPGAKATLKDVTAAAKIKGPKGTEALVVALGAESAAVRKAAVMALGDRGDSAADGPLTAIASADKSAEVREEAKRARVKLRPRLPADTAKIVVEVPAVTLLATDVPAEAGDALTKIVRTSITADPRRPFLVKETVEGEKGYGVLVAIRSVTTSKQGTVNVVEVKCELTLLALPNRSLRLSSSATAAAGIEGTLDAETRTELIHDAIGACGPALAEDFLDYATSRPAP